MLTTQQTKIYEGLKQIGEAIANFYLDAVSFVDPSCTIPSKANLIAHLAREIDSGIREAFSPMEKKAEIDKDLTDKGHEKVGHFASILALLGKKDPKDALAIEWFKIAKKFPTLAHHHKIYKASLSSDEITHLWNKYEKILFIIIGSFYGITNRLDGLLNHFPTTKDGLTILKNLVVISENASYFFGKLTNTMALDTLQGEGYFNIENAPKPNKEGIVIEWYPLRYLLNILTTEDIAVANKIAALVNNITKAYIDERIQLYTFSISILIDIIVNLKDYPFSLQSKEFFKKINEKTIQPAWNFYSTSLLEKGPEKYLKNSDKESIENLLDYVFSFIISIRLGVMFLDVKLRDEVDIHFFVEDYLVSKFTKEHGKNIVELLGKSAIDICIEKINKIKETDPYSFSEMDFPSIEVTSQTRIHNRWLTELLNFIRDYACYLLPEERDRLIADLIESDTEILRRLGLHFIRINFASYQNYWWKFISEHDIDDINIHEPYIIIQQTSNTYTSEQIKLTIDWIERIKEIEVNVENYSAKDNRYLNIRKWLSAFNEIAKNTNDYLKGKISYYNSLNDGNFDHPEYTSYYTSYVRGGLPKDADQFQNLSVEEQITYMNVFKPDYFNNITENGLKNLIASSVKNNPEKYLDKLKQFIPLQAIYVAGVIEGITSAIYSSKILDYTAILDFVEQEIASESFNSETKGERGYTHQLVSSIIRLLKALVETKPLFDFTHEDLLRLEKISIVLLRNEAFFDKDENINHSHLDHILNSLQGQSLEALLKITATWAEKFSVEGSTKKWNITTEEYFTSRLSRKENADKNFSIVLGVYLSWFIHFDKNWVYSNANQIFDKGNSQHFRYTLYGCFSNFLELDRRLYDFLTANNLFTSAIDEFTIEGREVDSLSTYALWEWYFLKKEPIDDNSILYKIIHNKNYQQLSSLIQITKRSKWFGNYEKKFIVKELLKTINNIESLNQIYAKLLWLLEDVNELNEEVADLVKTISQDLINSSPNLYSYMQHIFKLADSNLALAGNIIASILRSKQIIALYDKSLVVFTNKLYDAGYKGAADEICILVSEKKSLLLKELYHKHS